jgi:transposase InsO family protein
MQPDYILRQRAYARVRLIKDADRLGNVSAACRLHHVSRKSYYKWLRRYDGTIESLMDRPRTPHSHPKKLSEEQHAVIKRVYESKTTTDKRGKRRLPGLHYLHWLLRTYHGFTCSVSAIYKALKRMGFYGPAKRRRRRSYKRYELPWPGANVQIDVMYLDPIGQHKLYQYTAIDEHSRLCYAKVYDGISAYNSVRFLRDSLDFFERHHIRVDQVQTDHGAEFTFAMHPQVTKQHPFERELQNQGIARKLTPIGKPHLQGKVERLHRIFEDEFHSLRYYRSIEALRRAFSAYLTYYNHRRPHGSLDWRSPAQQLQAYANDQSVTYH